MAENTLVIGIGNELRGDDGVGLWVARRIAAASWPGVTAIAMEASDPSVLLHAWAGAERVYLVDAITAPLPPGSIVRLDLSRHPEAVASSTVSSHGLGLAEAIELGRALGLMPLRITLYGVVSRDFAYGTVLSPAVERAARQVVDRLRWAIRRSQPADARASPGTEPRQAGRPARV